MLKEMALTMLKALIDEDISYAREKLEQAEQAAEKVKEAALREKAHNRNYLYTDMWEHWETAERRRKKAKLHLIDCLNRRLALLEHEEKE
jgi:hypothetical protein